MRSIHAIMATTALVAVVCVGTGTPALAKHKPTCGDIIAAYEDEGSKLSPEELAQKMKVSVKRVRECMKTKEANPPDAPPAEGQPKQ